MSLATIPISQIMTRTVKTAREEDSVHQAVKTMSEHKISSVVIVGADMKPVGMFTEKDAIRVIAKEKDALGLRLKEVMSSPIISINVLTSIKMALVVMATKNMNHLPVTENEKLVGIVTEKDIFRFVLRHEGLILELLSETAPTVYKEVLAKFGTQLAEVGVWPEPRRTDAAS